MKAPATTTYDDLLATQPTRHGAPAAPHGKRDLGLLMLAAFLLCGLLNLSGCAGPARLPERPVVQHAAHDSRTKTAEPLPSRIR